MAERIKGEFYKIPHKHFNPESAASMPKEDSGKPIVDVPKRR